MTTRDERLLALGNAADEFTDREITRLNDEVTFLNSIKDRADSTRLSAATTEAASVLLQDEIDAFLEE